MKIQSPPAAMSFDPYAVGDYAEHQIGVEVTASDGRRFRYAKVGASDIGRGKLQLAPTPKTNHHNIAWSSGGALGDNKVTFTLGATAAVANEYAGGLLVTSDATGEGTSYLISGHPAADSAATLELTLADPIVNVALVSGSEACLVHNRYNGVIEGTSSTQLPAGIPLVNASAGKFVWLQVYGQCPALADETLAVGSALTTGTSTAGAVEVEDWQLQATDASRVIEEFRVGFAHVAGVDTEYRPIFLTIL